MRSIIHLITQKASGYQRISAAAGDIEEHLRTDRLCSPDLRPAEHAIGGEAPKSLQRNGRKEKIYVSRSKTNTKTPYLLRLQRCIIDLEADDSYISDMQKEAFIKKLFEKQELTVTFYPSTGVYGMKIPASLQKEGLPKKVTGKTREIVIQKTFDLFAGRGDIKCGTTLSDLFEEFIRERESDIDFAAHTVRKNRCDWNVYYKGTPLVKVAVGLLKPSDLMEHFKSMTEGRKLTRHAFGNAKGLLNQLFDMAYAKDLISSNICRDLSVKRLKFRPETNKQDQVYSKAERDRIVERLEGSRNVYDQAIVMQFCLGCRVSEVKALYWSDIDFTKKRVYIHREVVDGRDGGQIIKDQTKNGMSEGNRELPLTARAERVLATIPKPEDKNSLIFQREYKPLRTQSVNDHLRAVCRELGIEYLSTHKIRAFGITEALAAGMDQASVMRIAGHASPETMRHYVRVAKVKKDISEKYDSVFD